MQSAKSSVSNRSDRSAISVVVPLPDHRGHAVEAIRSWACEQTLDRNDYEVVVIVDRREPEVEAEVAKLLTERDQLVTLAQGSLHDCYNAGAKAARGDVLLFTESHVQATPDCLSEIAARFRGDNVDVVAVASGGIDATRFAGQEQIIYEEALPERIAGGWNVCTVRGCAIRRFAYDRAGGFPARYGHFSELLLGASLRHTGARSGYAERARVFHFNSGTLAHFRSELIAFGRDEIRFRTEQPSSPLLEFLGPRPAWDQRERWQRSGAARHCGVCLVSAVQHAAAGNFKAAGRACEELVRFAPAILLGPAWLVIKASLVVWWAVLLLYLLYPSKHGYYLAFRAMWNGQIRRGHALEIAERLMSRQTQVGRSTDEESAVALARAA